MTSLALSPIRSGYIGKHRKVPRRVIGFTAAVATVALAAAPMASAATIHLPGGTVVTTTPSGAAVSQPNLGTVSGAVAQLGTVTVGTLNAANAVLGQYGLQGVINPTTGAIALNGAALNTPLGNAIMATAVSAAGANLVTVFNSVPFLGAGSATVTASPTGVGGGMAFTPPFIGPVALTGSAGLNGLNGNAVFSVPFLGAQQVGFAVTPTGVSVTLPGVGTVSSQQLVNLAQAGVPVAIATAQALLANGITLPLPGGSVHAGLGGVSYSTGAFGFGSSGSLGLGGGSFGVTTPVGGGNGAVNVGLTGVTGAVNGNVDLPGLEASTTNQGSIGLGGASFDTNNDVELDTPVVSGSGSLDASGNAGISGVGGSVDTETEVNTPAGDATASGSGDVSLSEDGASGNADADGGLTTDLGTVEADASASGAVDSDGASADAGVDVETSLG